MYCADVTADVTGAVAGALDGPDASALQRLQTLLVAAATGAPGLVAQRACFLAKTTAELAAHDLDVAERSRQAFTDLAAALASCVAAAQRAGDIVADADPTQLGHYLLVVLRGTEALAESGFAEQAMRDAAAVAIKTLTSRDVGLGRPPSRGGHR